MGSAHTKKTRVKGNAATSLITIIDAITATGVYLDPAIIFKGKDLQWQWFTNEFAKTVPGWKFTVSPNGWTNNELALYWLEQVFLPQINAIRNNDESRTVLLILDGHGSHTTEEFMVFCYHHNINCLYLPAHTSHGLQALDNAVFACLKRAYESEVEQLNAAALDGSPVGKLNFIKCLKKAREAVSKKTVKKGFTHTGTWPISRAKALLHPEIQPDTKENAPGDPEGEAGEDVESDDEDSPAVTRDFIVDLAKNPTSNKSLRYSLKRIAEEVDDLRASLAFSERENTGLRTKIAELTKTKKKRAVPNPTQRFMDVVELAIKGYTIEALEDEENVEPAPKRRKKVIPVVVVEVEEYEEGVDSDGSEGVEAEVPAEIRTRSGRAVRSKRHSRE